MVTKCREVAVQFQLAFADWFVAITSLLGLEAGISSGVHSVT